MSNFLAIDQGTTSSRAIVFNSGLNAITDSQQEYSLSYPNDGWVEADPADILNTVRDTVSDVLKKENAITACGITNQRESTVVWSRETDEPIYPAIIWQDRRTHEFCKKLKDSGHEKMVREKTGLVIDPYFSATKIKWILDNVTGARELANNGKLMFGTIDCYLIYKLTKEKKHYTDVTNASRTMLFNINEMKWDKDLLDLFDIPISMMPSVQSCDANFGTLAVGNKNISIKGVIGDQQAALVGQNCFNYGDMKSTYGTGCFLMVNTKENIITLDEGLLTTVGYQLNNNIGLVFENHYYNSFNTYDFLNILNNNIDNIKSNHIGAYFVDYKKSNSEINKSIFKFGFFDKKYDLTGYNISDKGFTLGYGINYFKTKNFLDVSFKFGKKSFSNNIYSDEDYYQIVLSLISGEKWFVNERKK